MSYIDGLVAELGEGGREAHAFALDVRDREAVGRLERELAERGLLPDVLVNNAGLSRGLDPLHEGEIDDWDEMIDTNVKGLLYVTRAFLPHMVARNHGDVVNIGSDMNQMVPMHAKLQHRYEITPAHWLADGGFTKLQAINELTERGTQPVVPPPKSRNPDIDCLQPKPDDTPAQAQWRELMGSDWGKELYLQRAATVECANAQLRRRGLLQFNVRGCSR